MNGTGTIDDVYFEWLYALIADPKIESPDKTYWSLARQLYITPFRWFVPNDKNRSEDGIELRSEFLGDSRLSRRDREWLDLECSVFEMLIALSRRAAYTYDEEPADWFWILIRNIGLKNYSDYEFNDAKARELERRLGVLMDRKYRSNGSGGGLFPLKNPTMDQREVEIWYQMSSYLLEGG